MDRITPEQISEIREAIEVVPPSPWETDSYALVHSDDFGTIAECETSAIAEYIEAVQPSVVLGLLDELEALHGAPFCPFCGYKHGSQYLHAVACVGRLSE